MLDYKITRCIIGVMTLAEYLQTFPRLERRAVRSTIAQSLGITEGYVRSMCNGHKPIPGKFAIGIERSTNGAVPRQITAPSLYPEE